MKKNELLYRAVGDINEKTAADAYDAGNLINDKSQNVRTALSIAASVVTVAGLFAFSMFLLRYTVREDKTDDVSGGTVTSDDTAQTERETEPDTETELETEQEPVTEADQNTETAAETTKNSVPDETSALPEVTEIVTEHPPLSELYNIYPYSEFLPAYFPDTFDAVQTSRVAPCLLFDSVHPDYFGPLEITEEGSVLLVHDAANLSDAEKEYYLSLHEHDYILIRIEKNDNSSTITPAALLSVGQIENSARLLENPFGDYNIKLSLSYNVTFCADGWKINVTYMKHGPEYTGQKSAAFFEVRPDDYTALDNSPQLTAEDLYNLITSAQYFKTHPVLENADEHGITKPSFADEHNGISLSVEFASNKYCWESLIKAKATVKNNTENAVTLVIPVIGDYTGYVFDIYRFDNTSVRLKNIDTYGINNINKTRIELLPGEEYTYNMRLTGDSRSFGEQGGVEQGGLYYVDAKIAYTDNSGSYKEESFRFKYPLGIYTIDQGQSDYEYISGYDKVDFSELPVENIIKAEIKSGSSGELMTFTESDALNGIASGIKKLKGLDRVSARSGYYGFYYNIKLYDENGLVLELSLAAAEHILYSDYEVYEGYTYKAMYTAEDKTAFNELKTYIDRIFK